MVGVGVDEGEGRAALVHRNQALSLAGAWLYFAILHFPFFCFVTKSNTYRDMETKLVVGRLNPSDSPYICVRVAVKKSTTQVKPRVLPHRHAASSM